MNERMSQKVLRTNDIVKSRKIGGSVYVPVTNWIEPDKLFKVIKVDEKSFMLKEVKIVQDDDDTMKIK